MIELKFLIPPFIALAVFAEKFLSSFSDAVRLAIDLAAICILAAGFLVLGRLRGALSASEASANAWKDERDAAVVRADRHREELMNFTHKKEEEARILLGQISDLRVEITKLQERPTIESIEAKIDILAEQIRLGRDEVAERILQAIERLKPNEQPKSHAT